MVRGICSSPFATCQASWLAHRIGHVARDERVTTALVREAAEEAGIQLAEADVQCVPVMQRKCVWCVCGRKRRRPAKYQIVHWLV